MMTTLKAKVLDYLDARPYWYRKENGLYHGEIYTDYRDELEVREVIKILNEDDPWAEFIDLMACAYDEVRWEYTDDLADEIINEVGLADDDKDELMDILMDLVVFDLPLNHYLNQEFRVNISLDTGDENYDYVLNTAFQEYDDGSLKIDEKAGIVWLAESQGYTKKQLETAIEREEANDSHKFLTSMVQELDNLPNAMSTVTFLVRMTLRQLFELNDLIGLQYRNGPCFDATKKPDCGYSATCSATSL